MHSIADFMHLNCLSHGVDGDVVELDEALGRDDLDLDGGEESEGAVGPGHGVEQVGVLRLGARDHGAVGDYQLKRFADVL